MFGLLKKSAKKGSGIAIGVGPSAVYFVNKNSKEGFVRKDALDNTERLKVISDYLSEIGASRSLRVSLVLLKGLYNVIQIDKPKVPDEELPSAIPWAIKDFVQDQVSNLAVDYIDMPKSPSYPNDKIMVVSAVKSLIRSLISTVEAQAVLDIITAEEITLADLYNADDEHPHLMLFQPNGYELSLVAIWHSRIFLTRTLRGYSDLPRYLPGAVSTEILDNMSLEMQRSIDYMVAQLKLPSPKLLTIALDCQDNQSIADYLSQTFSFTVNVIGEETGKQSMAYLPLVAVLDRKDES
jgi:MSHA biogenesis protein MshI